MRKTILISLLSMGLLSGCASFGPNAIIYTSGKLGKYAYGEKGTKSGRACMTSIFGYFSFGDASMAAAAKTAQITHVSTVDYEFENVMGIYGQYCTAVTGE